MVIRALKHRAWGKWEIFFTYLLLAALISEVMVIFIINTGSGSVLAQFLAYVGTNIVQRLSGPWKWIYRMVGPMVFPLFILTIVEIWSICSLLRYWRSSIDFETPEKQYKALSITEGVAPGFGFLGTCISLIFTMHNMDPTLTQSDMLKVLLENSSSAFGSTVYGISLAITAFLSQEIFKGYLIEYNYQSNERANVTDDPGENESMNLIKREANYARNTRS